MLALKFAPAMLAKTPIVLETEGLGRKEFPRECDSPREPPYRECSRNDCRVCAREQSGQYHR